MSDLNADAARNPKRYCRRSADAATRPPEALTLQKVKHEAEFYLLCFGHEAVRELYAHFGVKSADDLAATDWREFIRLTNMSCEDRAAVVRRERTVSPAIALELNGNATVTMRDKAVALAKMGFRVFPVKPGAKAPAQPPNKPRPPKGQYHQRIPSRDPAEVAAMWTGRLGASLSFDIGINTEGLLVLDIDDRDGRTGAASFAELARMHGLDLDTVVASTPSGGRHYFYKLPADVDPTTVMFGSDKLGSGIDHRSYNSFVVAVGTKRANGEYRWVRSPTKLDMKESPRSLIELCQRSRERKSHDPLVVPGFEVDQPDAMERFRQFAVNNAPEAVEGASGRAETIALLRRAGDYGLMALTAVEILCEPEGWNELKAHPPWDEDELLELAESLEPSRDSPIGCDHPSSQFDRVEKKEEDRANEGEKAPRLPECINITAWPDRPLKERQWVVRDRILKGNVALLSGDGGIGQNADSLRVGGMPAAG